MAWLLRPTELCKAQGSAACDVSMLSYLLLGADDHGASTEGAGKACVVYVFFCVWREGGSKKGRPCILWLLFPLHPKCDVERNIVASHSPMGTGRAAARRPMVARFALSVCIWC
jgi:hypothetical protein